MKPFKLIVLVAGIFLHLIVNGTVYEAETAELFNAVTEDKNSGFSGISYINFDNEAGSFLELRVGMKTAGEQKITIRFANGGTSARPMKIELNNSVVVESLSFKSTGGWTNWDTISINAVFNAGVNKLKCTSIGSDGGPNIDLFDISGEQAQTYALNLSVDGEGQIIQIPDKGLLFENEEITLIAKPDYNSAFLKWSGDFNSELDTLKFSLDSDRIIQAYFVEIEMTLPEPDFSMKGYATVSGESIETTTGGADGKTIIIETLDQLVVWGANRENNYTAETVIIKGKIEAAETTVITIKRGKDISILGNSENVGDFGELKNVSINIRDYSNVIVRNLKMHEVFYPNDDLTIDNCHHVWIDHCEFYSKIGQGIGIDTYDGLLDIKKGSRNVTVSWCHFHDHMKTVLIGHSDNTGEQDKNLQVTFHHNWFSNTDGRNPSLRFGLVHYFNNYLENITDYGFAVRNGAHAKIENCHFENVKLPIATNKFTGHGYACVSGCIYSGSTSESDNQISEPVDCDFWNDKITYEYSLESTNTVLFSTKTYSGVGKIDVVTHEPFIESLNGLELRNLFFSNDNLHLSFITKSNDKLTFTVYTINGLKLYSETQIFFSGPHQIILPVSTLKNGIYLISIESSSERISKKWIKF